MSPGIWKLGAAQLVAGLQRREYSAREAATSVLARIDALNPRIGAVVDVMREEALAAADAADRALADGRPIGPLHGVPVTIKVNVDVAGHATTDGVAALRDPLVRSDSPVVASLRAAGAVIVGRNNAPAFSLRWFTDNDAHGRTLNPFDATRTPGGSSGGAAAALACGFGALALGSDYGGSIRHPAWCCGVVGLRPTPGRVPAYRASAPERVLSNQQMSVQGPMARCIADVRLGLRVMARGSPLDPLWVDAPLDRREAHPLRVAVFKHHPAYDGDASVLAAIEQAEAWLAGASSPVEEVEPPHFEEAAQLWRRLVMQDLRFTARPLIETLGDSGVRSAMAGYLHDLPPLDAAQTAAAQARRFQLAREWSVLLDRFDVLLMPVSWQRAFPIDADLGAPAEVAARLLPAQSPLLATAMLGLPGLAVPTGMAGGLPAGVQLVAGRFREDRLLRAGEIIERAAHFDVIEQLETLAPATGIEPVSGA